MSLPTRYLYTMFTDDERTGPPRGDNRGGPNKGGGGGGRGRSSFSNEDYGGAARQPREPRW